jgi:hypothetical protein
MPLPKVVIMRVDERGRELDTKDKVSRTVEIETRDKG